MSTMSLAEAQAKFIAHIPALDATARYAFRRRRRQDREELLAEARGACWSAWAGLLRRGRNPTEVGVTGIAHFAIKYVQRGSRLGNPACGGHGARDIFHPRTRRACGTRIFSFEELASWRDWLIAVDLSSWLATLTEKKRQAAEWLAAGEEPGRVAWRLGVVPGRISQVRRELEASGQAFQGGANSAWEPGQG
jgi:hypothetical protein